MAKATDIGTLLAVTREKLSTKGAVDNVTRRMPTLDLIKPIFKSTGGNSILAILEAAESAEAVATDASGTFSTAVSSNIHGHAKYDWSVPIVNSTRLRKADLLKATGPEAQVALAQAYMKSAIRGHAKKIQRMLFALDADVTAGTIFSLDQLCSDEIVLGGIDPTTTGNEFWKATRHYVGAAASKANVVGGLRDLADGIEDNGGDRESIVYVAGPSVIRAYEEAMDDKVRYVNLGKGETQFKTLEFDGTLLRRDPNCQTDRVYALNLEQLDGFYANDAFLKVDAPQAVPGTLDHVTPIYSVLAMSTASRRSHGVSIFAAEPTP